MMQPPPSDPAVEDALVPVSALQHYLFCPRQCALIHVERIWAEDGATAEGRILHERVDGGRSDRRRGVRTVRGIALRSFAHGLAGKADAVEFSDGDSARSEEHTSELQSLMRTSYAVFCLTKKKKQ